MVVKQRKEPRRRGASFNEAEVKLLHRLTHLVKPATLPGEERDALLGLQKKTERMVKTLHG